VLYGRGAADMKGSVAAFVVALERYVAAHPDHRGTVALLLTSDEEGDAIDGVRKVAEVFRTRGQRIDWCITGEPSSKGKLGDLLRVGRRGSLSATLTVRGIQGHVAYPERADNPIPRLLALLRALGEEPLDGGSAHFQPSQLVITSVDVGNPATNLIPASAAATFNVRFNDRYTARTLEAALRARLDASGGAYRLATEASAEAFLTPPGPFTDLLQELIERELGIAPDLSTSGGTSDARFLKSICPVAEFGLVGATIHQVDEQVPIADLEALTRIYQALLARFVRPA
jgi:succinyl-diaminopimelate desuccinylase